MSEPGINLLRLGLNIRRHRRYIQRLTQAQLAERVGCTAQAISEYENGKREVTVTMLLALSEALSCSAADLLQGVKVV